MLLFCLVVLTFTEAARQFYFQMPVFILYLLKSQEDVLGFQPVKKILLRILIFLKESPFWGIWVGVSGDACVLCFFFFPFKILSKGGKKFPLTDTGF